MPDEQTPLEPEAQEPVYIISPHPEAHIVTSEETVSPGEPEVAEETLEDLIAAQVQSQVSGMLSEIQTELQNEFMGGLELHAKG